MTYYLQLINKLVVSKPDTLYAFTTSKSVGIIKRYSDEEM